MKYRAQGMIFRKILERLKAGSQGLRANQVKGKDEMKNRVVKFVFQEWECI